MAEEIAPAAAVSADQRYFLIRRLHSLSGLIPIGFYLFFHLVINATIIFGPEAYQFGVDRIHDLDTMGLLLAVEMVFIFIPLAFHGLVGIAIWLTSTPNASVYQYAPNYRYTLQRWSGLIAFAFILVHVWQMHWLGKPFGGGQFDAHRAAESAMAVMDRWWIIPLYAIGVIASVYHLANGIWTFLITWGITLGPRSQRYSGYACTAFGVFLGAVGLIALYGFTLRGPVAVKSKPHDTEVVHAPLPSATEIAGQ